LRLGDIPSLTDETFVLGGRLGYLSLVVAMDVVIHYYSELLFRTRPMISNNGIRTTSLGVQY
jgi:hypothetical protein